VKVNSTYYGSIIYGESEQTLRADDTPPTINLEYPEDNTINSSDKTPDFIFNVTDNTASVLDCELFIMDYEGNIRGYGNNQSVLNDTTTKITANTSLYDGNYTWWINCSDGLNINQSETRNLTIAFPFVITLEYPADETENTTTRRPEFFFHVFGNSQTYLCDLFLNNTGYGRVVADNGFSTSITPNASLYNGSYLWWINCSTFAYTNQSATREILVNLPVIETIAAVSSGGSNMTSTNAMNIITISQAVIGNVTSTNYMANIGFIYLLNNPPVFTGPIPDQTWYTGSNVTLNMGDYFYDVEDELTYTSTNPENITVYINNTDGTVILEPYPNWGGTRYIIFTAHDYETGTNSNNITLKVIDLQTKTTKYIYPVTVISYENETVGVTINVKANFSVNDIPMINITDDIPYDFTPPNVSSVRVYFIDYSSSQKIEITGNETVNVSILDQPGTKNTLLMVNISNVSKTDANSYMQENDSIQIEYEMVSSQLEPDSIRSMYTNSSLTNNISNVVRESINTTIESSVTALRAYKKVWFPNASNPQNASVKIVIESIGGSFTELQFSDYLPAGAVISDRHMIYYNSTSDTTIELFNGSDFYVSDPIQDYLPDGLYVDIYVYNLTYNFTNWDGYLYDNDTITLTYNVTVIGGGTWTLPTILGGYDPQYKKHIRTETHSTLTVPLFDIILNMITEKVSPGEVVKALLKLMNIGGPKAQVDMEVTYSMKKMNGELITESTDTVAVLNQKEYELDLRVPKNTKPDIYTFEALATYYGREAISTRTFEVTGQEAGYEPNILSYLAAIIAGIVVAMFLFLRRR